MQGYIFSNAETRDAQDNMYDDTRSIDEQVFAQLQMASNTERFTNRDPVYHLGETFARTFDAVGQRLASAGNGALAQRDGNGEKETSEVAGTHSGGTNSREPASFMDAHRQKPSLKGTVPMPERKAGGFIGKFSQETFCNGTLAGAVINGTSRAVLMSCIKRGGGLVEKNENQRMSQLEPGSTDLPVSGSDSRVFFNANTCKSAVGMVIEANRKASQVLDDIAGAAMGLSDKHVSTYAQMFPFLFDAREHALMQRLSAKRAQMQLDGRGSSPQYAAIERGISKCSAVINRKQQEKALFLTKLEQMRENALLAQNIFEQTDASITASDEVISLQTDEPPDDNDSDDDPGAHTGDAKETLIK